MKNKNCIQSIFSTKFVTRHPKNIHPKTDHNPVDKKDTKNNFFSPRKTAKKPTSTTHKPSQTLTSDQQHEKDTKMLQNNTVLYLFYRRKTDKFISAILSESLKTRKTRKRTLPSAPIAIQTEKLTIEFL